MYAHQVIEDLKRIVVEGDKKIVNTGMVSNAMFRIGQSQSFHMGDYSGIINTFSVDKGKKIPVYIQEEFMRPPYPVTWIDFHYNGDKFGRLAMEFDDAMYVIPFCKIKGDETWTPQVFYFGFRNGEGYLGVSALFSTEYIQGMSIKSDIEKHAMSYHLTSGTLICNFNQLITCKNIGTVDNEPSDKLNKSRVKKGKQPIFTYKTLVIKPTSKRQESLEAQGLWENRIHLCRGHFKEYSDEKPLFGKYTGRYWWQPSVRGRNTEGVVMKDYEVKST